MHPNGAPWYMQSQQPRPLLQLGNANFNQQQQQQLLNTQILLNHQFPPNLYMQPTPLLMQPQSLLTTPHQLAIRQLMPTPQRPFIMSSIPTLMPQQQQQQRAQTPQLWQSNSFSKNTPPPPLLQQQPQPYGSNVNDFKLQQEHQRQQQQRVAILNDSKPQQTEQQIVNPLKAKFNHFETNESPPTKVFRFEKQNQVTQITENICKSQSNRSTYQQSNEQSNRQSNNSHNDGINENKTNNELPSLLSLKILPPSTVQTLPKSLLQSPYPPPPLPLYQSQTHKNLIPILNDNNNLNKKVENKVAIVEKKHKIISIEDLLQKPGRDSRPSKIAIILRGLPGSGKSYLANLIKVMEYEYDEAMNDVYERSLVKSFKKTLDDCLFDFIIVDMINERMVYVEEMCNYAKAKGVQVFVIELSSEVQSCFGKNVHNRSLADIQNISNKWELLPQHYVKLDCRCLLQDDAIENVEMDDVETVDKNEEAKKEADSSSDDESEEDVAASTPQFVKSKWEAQDMSEDRLNRLDGISSANKRSRAITQENETNLSLDSYLEINLKTDSMKRVKWKDFEEEKRLAKHKELGFIVGQTAEDWKKITDKSYKSDESALKTYKYI